MPHRQFRMPTANSFRTVEGPDSLSRNLVATRNPNSVITQAYKAAAARYPFSIDRETYTTFHAQIGLVRSPPFLVYPYE